MRSARRNARERKTNCDIYVVKQMKGEHKYKVGDIVRISDNLSHDRGKQGQFGVIYDVAEYWYRDVLREYGVILYDSYDAQTGRFCAFEFDEDELFAFGGRFEDLIEAYAEYLSDRCWKNTDHTNFNAFMKALKRIRKKYRAIVKKRMK